MSQGPRALRCPRSIAALAAVGALVTLHAACGSETALGPAEDASAGPDQGLAEGGAPDQALPALDAGGDAELDATPREAGRDAELDATPSDVDGAVDAADAADAGPAIPPNILMVIADDTGVDANVCYTVAADPGRAPRIAELCARGVTFDNFWAMPSCSPTRASVLTGRYGFRTRVGFAGGALPPGERGLPAALAAGNPAYALGAVGKWHVQNTANGGPNHPNLLGFSHYAGNLQGAVANYTNWARTVNGVTATETGYATTVTTNDARDWIDAQTTPWFMWLAYNAGHSPFHSPPAALHTYPEVIGVAPPARPITHHHAMIEAMDTELGRLLDGLTPAVRARTWVIFMGDNGTPTEVAQAPVLTGKAKATLYQGGMLAPLTISGPGVVAPGRRVSALVQSVDLFKTILELADVDMAAALPAGGNTVDSVSLVPYLLRPSQPPLRTWVMNEQFGSSPPFGLNGKTMRDEAFKLIRFDSGVLELYDLRVDPWEANDLMTAPLSVEADAHLTSLTNDLDTLLASL